MKQRRIPRLFVFFLCLCGIFLLDWSGPLTPVKASDPVQSWIQQHAYPLQATDPTASPADLQPFKHVVGNASIIGLGEASHGTHEFFALKARLVKYLVEYMGVRTFTMEINWSIGQLFDRYITSGIGDPHALVSQIAPWNTQEVLDLVTWMRTYNLSHVQKLHFIGMNMQAVDTTTYTTVINYLQQSHSPLLDTIQQLYAGPASASDYQSLPLTTRQLYAANAWKAFQLLQTLPVDGDMAYDGLAWVQQNAHVIAQFTQIMLYDLTTEQGVIGAMAYRDLSMADNVSWLHDHQGGKMVVWAHDAHIAESQYFSYVSPAFSQWKYTGQYLHERYLTQYLAIGTSFYQGSFNAYGPDFTMHVFTVGMPRPDSYNATLGDDNILLDLRSFPHNGPLYDWAQGPSNFRWIGGYYDPSETTLYEGVFPVRQYYLTSLLASFSAVIQLRLVTPSHLL